MHPPDVETTEGAEVVVVADQKIGLVGDWFFGSRQFLIKFGHVSPIDLTADLHSFRQRDRLPTLPRLEINRLVVLADKQGRELGIRAAVLVRRISFHVAIPDRFFRRRHPATRSHKAPPEVCVRRRVR